MKKPKYCVTDDDDNDYCNNNNDNNNHNGITGSCEFYMLQDEAKKTLYREKKIMVSFEIMYKNYYFFTRITGVCDLQGVADVEDSTDPYIFYNATFFWEMFINTHYLKNIIMDLMIDLMMHFMYQTYDFQLKNNLNLLNVLSSSMILYMNLLVLNTPCDAYVVLHVIK